MNKPAKYVLTLTAFAPVLLIYSYVAATSGRCLLAATFVAFCALLVFLCIFLIRRATRNLVSRTYETQVVETADSEIFTFLLIYLLPLITRDIQTYNWYVWIMITVLFCFVVATSYGFHFNPLLSVLGYHFYKIARQGEVTHVLITKRRLYKVGETLTVVRLSEYVLIEKTPPD